MILNKTLTRALWICVIFIIVAMVVATHSLGLSFGAAAFFVALYLLITFIARWMDLRLVSTLLATVAALYLGGSLMGEHSVSILLLSFLLFHGLNYAVDVMGRVWGTAQKTSSGAQSLDILMTILPCLLILMAFMAKPEIAERVEQQVARVLPPKLLRYEVTEPLDVLKERLQQFGSNRKVSRHLPQRTAPPLPATANPGGYTRGRYPQQWVHQLMLFENHPLATGRQKVDVVHADRLVPGVREVGFGATPMQIEDAVRMKVLPPGTRLPMSMNGEEARRWIEEVTLPTYFAIVRSTVKVPLTISEEFALLSFCHNLGVGSLRQLVNGPDRLNSGRQFIPRTADVMLKYTHANGVHKEALLKRRYWERELLTSPKETGPPTLASR